MEIVILYTALILTLLCLTASRPLYLYGIKYHKSILNHVTSFNKKHMKILGYDKVGLPIIKVTICKGAYYFMLDTGANANILDTELLKYLPKNYYHKTGDEKKVTGIGEIQKTYNISLKIKLSNDVYEEEFLAGDIKKVQTAILELSGIKIAGILSTSFMEKHKISLDLKRRLLWFK